MAAGSGRWGKNNRVQQDFEVGVDRGSVKSYSDPQLGSVSPGQAGSRDYVLAGVALQVSSLVPVRAKWWTPRGGAPSGV